MVRLYFYVEGQTEQEYVARVLRPHLARIGVQVMGAVLAASGRKHGHTYRGGGRRYQSMRKDLGNLLKQDARDEARFTTMFDCIDCTMGFLAGTRPREGGKTPVSEFIRWKERLRQM